MRKRGYQASLLWTCHAPLCLRLILPDEQWQLSVSRPLLTQYPDCLLAQIWSWSPVNFSCPRPITPKTLSFGEISPVMPLSKPRQSEKWHCVHFYWHEHEMRCSVDISPLQPHQIPPTRTPWGHRSTMTCAVWCSSAVWAKKCGMTEMQFLQVHSLLHHS